MSTTNIPIRRRWYRDKNYAEVTEVGKPQVVLGYTHLGDEKDWITMDGLKRLRDAGFTGPKTTEVYLKGRYLVTRDIKRPAPNSRKVV